jgi:hypothetical protein
MYVNMKPQLGSQMWEQHRTWPNVNFCCRVDELSNSERNIRESSDTTILSLSFAQCTPSLCKQLPATTVASYAKWLMLFRQVTVNSDEENVLLPYSNGFFTAGFFLTINTQLNTF